MNLSPTLVDVERKLGNHLVAEATSFAVFQKFSAVWLSPPLGHAPPMTIGSGAGDNGISFNRGPVKQAKLSGTIATPIPASTAAIRLAALSCSSAILGSLLVGTNNVSRYS